MKTLFLILLLYSGSIFSQTSLQGTIRDSKKKHPLPFCWVTIKGSRQSCIANEDGVFRLSVNQDRDSLIFSFLGYKKKTLAASAIARNSTIFLESSEILIDEVVIHADDDYLYDILVKCRKQMNVSPSHTAKVYFNLETEYPHQSIEMLECYDNCIVNGNSIEDLQLKNGRIGLAETMDSSYFVSLNTSKAITYLNLTKSSEYLPLVPFQLSKSRMRKVFSLKMMAVFEDGNPVYHIGFAPRKNDGKSFQGEAWIDKKTYAILKVVLNGEKLAIHPFIPLWDKSMVDSVGMNITLTYNISEQGSILNTLNFNYSLEFRKGIAIRYVNTRGIMYFYDFEDPFILPYFNYDVSQSDYRKITFLPYNASFWNNSKGLIYTEKQKDVLVFLKKRGMLLNYIAPSRNLSDLIVNKYGKVKAGFFEDNLVYWSDTSRLTLKKNHLNKDSLAKIDINNLKVKADQYHFKAQIFLDINPVGDSLQWYSATIFDVFESFYKLPEAQTTNCFLNIFFDLCEIERRKMETQLHAISHPGKALIDSIYNQTLKDIEKQTSLFFKKAQSGDNLTELKKYNDLVYKNLGIDNFKIFGVTESE